MRRISAAVTIDRTELIKEIASIEVELNLVHQLKDTAMNVSNSVNICSQDEIEPCVEYSYNSEVRQFGSQNIHPNPT